MNETHQDEEPCVEIIETLEDLEYLSRWLAGVKRLSLDIEADSFYTYHPKICLLQISNDDYDFIIDPLAVKDMSPLGPVLRDPAVEKVFHAAEYDLQCLKRDYGFQISHIFDTMVAARLLGHKQLGLAALILEYFDVSLTKKFQRADWGKRPLTPGQIEYARMDTHYLLPLRDLLYKELDAKGRLHEAMDSFERLARVEPPEKTFDPDHFWRLSGARLLSPQGRSVLRALYYFREKTAAETDKAPFRIFSEMLLVRLAQHCPKNSEDMEKIQGITPYLMQRFGRDLLEVIHKGLNAQPIAHPPERLKQRSYDANALKRFQVLREWRKKKAEERGLDPVAIMHTDDLRKIAQAAGQEKTSEAWLAVISAHKRDLYGNELLKILNVPTVASQATLKRRRRRSRR